MNKWMQWLKAPRNQDELLTLLRTAETDKIIDAESERMLEGVLQMSQLQVRDIMIPRADIVSIQKDYDLAQIITTIAENLHSRYPIFGHDRHELYGILLAKEILQFTLAENQSRFDLGKISQPAMLVPETLHLNKLLNNFKNRRTHMAGVIDEYGSIVGLVTLEDVLEQIVGDIEDETDYDEENSIKQHKNYWVVKASTSLNDFNQAFDTRFDEDNCETIGGLVTNQFGYIPKRHDVTTIENLQFKILNADKRRIKLLHVTKNVA